MIHLSFSVSQSSTCTSGDELINRRLFLRFCLNGFLLIFKLNKLRHFKNIDRRCGSVGRAFIFHAENRGSTPGGNSPKSLKQVGMTVTGPRI